MGVSWGCRELRLQLVPHPENLVVGASALIPPSRTNMEISTETANLQNAELCGATSTHNTPTAMT